VIGNAGSIAPARRAGKGILPRAAIRQGRAALKSCKRLFIALRSCPATQHFTHGKKYFEKMLARFQVRA